MSSVYRDCTVLIFLREIILKGYRWMYSKILNICGFILLGINLNVKEFSSFVEFFLIKV